MTASSAIFSTKFGECQDYDKKIIPLLILIS